MTRDQPCRNFTSRQVAWAVIFSCVAALPGSPTIADERSNLENESTSDEVGDQALDVVAHWKFQNGIAGSAASGSLIVEDSSGNSRHGRAVGGPLYHKVELPTTNLALAFDGHDDRIAVPDDRLFHLKKSFTIEAWIEIAFYPGSRQNRSFIVFRGDDRAGFDPWYLGLEESGQLTFQISDSLNKGSVVRSPKPLPTRKFLHVAAVFDHETGVQGLFIDGKRVATARTKIRAGGPLGGTRPGIGIGGRQDHSHQGFKGSIAELRITASALSKSQFLLHR